jgi:hypothetical protein
MGGISLMTSLHFLAIMFPMLKQISVLLIALFFMGTTSWAMGLNGIWRGTGSYEESSWGAFQATVEVTISYSAEQLMTRDCWSFSSEGRDQTLCTPYQFDVQKNEIFLDGNLVGKIEDSKIQISFYRGTKRIEAFFIVNSDQTASFQYKLSTAERFTKAAAFNLNKCR